MSTNIRFETDRTLVDVPYGQVLASSFLAAPDLDIAGIGNLVDLAVLAVLACHSNGDRFVRDPDPRVFRASIGITSGALEEAYGRLEEAKKIRWIAYPVTGDDGVEYVTHGWEVIHYAHRVPTGKSGATTPGHQWSAYVTLPGLAFAASSAPTATSAPRNAGMWVAMLLWAGMTEIPADRPQGVAGFRATYVGQETLAELLGISVRTVKTRLGELRDLGAIVEAKARARSRGRVEHPSKLGRTMRHEGWTSKTSTRSVVEVLTADTAARLGLTHVADRRRRYSDLIAHVDAALAAGIDRPERGDLEAVLDTP